MNIASYIDHTVLKPTTMISDVEKLCTEALQYHFAAVCVPPPFVKLAKSLTNESKIKTATVIGFPFGYSAIEAKVAETVLAIVDNADELDMVASITAIKNAQWDYLKQEAGTMVNIIHQKQRILKIIIESGILTDEEIIKCCSLYADAGVDFVKTSTGYAEKGATIEAVQLMRKYLPKNIKIKASGGIRTYAFAKELIDAGAERLGCSAGVEIVKQQRAPQ